MALVAAVPPLMIWREEVDMAEINYEALLPALRFNLRESENGESCTCRAFTESELLALLEKHGGDIRAASYEGLLRKAEDDSFRLPDGLELAGGRDYWLGLARYYRPCAARHMPRADEVWDDEQ